MVSTESVPLSAQDLWPFDLLSNQEPGSYNSLTSLNAPIGMLARAGDFPTANLALGPMPAVYLPALAMSELGTSHVAVRSRKHDNDAAIAALPCSPIRSIRKSYDASSTGLQGKNSKRESMYTA